MTTTKAIKTTPRPKKGRPFKKFYCDRDETFLLPLPAFKLWMFYYRLEGAKREGWASRATIVEKCGLNKDTVTKWRNWLVKHGWLKQLRTHNTGTEFGIPVMQVTRGVIPGPTTHAGQPKGYNPRLKRIVTATTEANSHGTVTEANSHGPRLKPSVTARPKPSVTATTDGTSHNVDVKTEVDRKAEVDTQKQVDGPADKRSGSTDHPQEPVKPLTALQKARELQRLANEREKREEALCKKEN